jgi:hypothetical protein
MPIDWGHSKETPRIAANPAELPEHSGGAAGNSKERWVRLFSVSTFSNFHYGSIPERKEKMSK